MVLSRVVPDIRPFYIRYWENLKKQKKNWKKQKEKNLKTKLFNFLIIELSLFLAAYPVSGQISIRYNPSIKASVI